MPSYKRVLHTPRRTLPDEPRRLLQIAPVSIPRSSMVQVMYRFEQVARCCFDVVSTTMYFRMHIRSVVVGDEHRVACVGPTPSQHCLRALTRRAHSLTATSTASRCSHEHAAVATASNSRSFFTPRQYLGKKSSTACPVVTPENEQSRRAPSDLIGRPATGHTPDVNTAVLWDRTARKMMD